MATIEEMRKRFMPKEDAEPPQPKKRTPLIEKMRARSKDKAASPKPTDKVEREYKRPGGKFSPATDEDGDDDAMLLFSKDHKGKYVSEMAKEGGEDAGFLYWIIERDEKEKAEGKPGFKAELVRIVKLQLGKV